MLQLKVTDRDHNFQKRVRTWLVREELIIAIEFREEHKYDDGKIMDAACAVVYLQHDDLALTIEDTESIDRLNAMAEVKP